MPRMAKKRRHNDPPEPQRPNRTGESLHVYIDPAIGEALRRFIAESEMRPSKTTAVEIGLRLLLTREGFWPPAQEKGGKE